nr:DNA polymerase III subunit beta [Stenotrophomonas pavanii]
MHIIANREAILAATAPLLAIAQRGLKTNQNIITVQALKDGRLNLSCCDDNATMASRAEAAVQQTGTFAVAAKRLHEIVRSFQPGAALALQSAGQQLAITQGRSRYRVNVVPAPEQTIRAGDVRDDASGEFTFDSGEFAYLLAVAQHGMNEPISPKIPNGILLHLTGERLRLIGTNGGRMAVASAAIRSNQPCKLLLGPNTIADLKAMLTKAAPGEQMTFRWGQGMLQVSCGCTEYRAGIPATSFVDYEAVMKRSAINPFHVGLEDLRGMVARMLIVSERLTVRLQGRTLSVATEIGEGKKKGEECTESVELPPDALQVDDFQVSVSGKYLLEAFNAVRGEPVHLSYAPGAPLTILAANGDARVYVMPIRA